MNLIEIFISGFVIFLAVSLFLILSRLRQGPSLADRVISIDLFSTLLLSAIVASAIGMREVILFDVAIIIALFNFLGTVIYARFIYNQGSKKEVSGE